MPLGEKGSHEQKDPPKKCYSTIIGSSNMKMVADRHRRAAYHNKHWQQAS